MKRRTTMWVFALCFGALLHVLLYWAVFFLWPFAEESVGYEENRLQVEYLSEVSPQMELFDPRPLLLPTRWNAANTQQLAEIIEEERSIFEDFPDELLDAEGRFHEDYGNRWEDSDSLLDLQLEFDFARVDQVGREADPQAVPQLENLHLSMLDPGSGDVIAVRTLYNVAKELNQRWPDWEPVTMMVTFQNSFLVPSFSILASSGYAEVDDFVKNYALEALRGEPGPANGAYLVQIGL